MNVVLLDSLQFSKFPIANFKSQLRKIVSRGMREVVEMPGEKRDRRDRQKRRPIEYRFIYLFVISHLLSATYKHGPLRA